MGKTALVVGGAGALGRAVLRGFKARPGWMTASLDLKPTDIDVDLDLAPSDDNWSSIITQALDFEDSNPRLDAVIHVAGGFIPGDLSADYSVFEGNWKMNVRSAFLAAQIAQRGFQKDKGLLLFTGAKAAMESGPGFAISYGMSKAATHHLAKSIHSENLLNTICILPGILDTKANREEMPDADFSTWTQLSEVAEKIVAWSESPESVREELFLEV